MLTGCMKSFVMIFLSDKNLMLNARCMLSDKIEKKQLCVYMKCDITHHMHKVTDRQTDNCDAGSSVS